MKRIFSAILLFILSNLTAQTTLIPDYRFERALIDLGIDSDHTINGQILTSDALAVTQLNLTPSTLSNYPYPANDYYEGMIHDLTGLEAFVNLERLVINWTMVDNINLENLLQLKYLNCVDNMLTSISVANNTQLEYLDISSGGDVYPFNYISEIDLSTNPNVNTLIAHGASNINLNNNNNLQNMYIDVGCVSCWGYPQGSIIGNICIKVDNVELAQNNQSPYSEWNVYHAYLSLNYTDNLTNCLLSTTTFNDKKIDVYPNPVTSGKVYLSANSNSISRIIMMDFLGRIVLERNKLVDDSIDISNLQKGNYLLRIVSDKGEQTEKLIVE